MGDGQAMIRKITGLSLLATAVLGLVPLACQPGGVGDPCTPEDEYTTTFSGFDHKEVNVESKSFQCETRVCLVNHFQGRVSCKYGQAQPATPADANCFVPGFKKDPAQTITTSVDPQLYGRQADAAVYCSCRCNGPDANARYCKCPSGYACEHLVDELGIGGGQLAGSYCVRDGTQYDPTTIGAGCSPTGYPKVARGAGDPNKCSAPDDG